VGRSVAAKLSKVPRSTNVDPPAGLAWFRWSGMIKNSHAVMMTRARLHVGKPDSISLGGQALLPGVHRREIDQNQIMA
jgi:hypothetical protein